MNYNNNLSLPHFNITAVCTQGCQHGDCVKPNVCNCEKGWEGATCSEGKFYFRGEGGIKLA